jgi:hypothetical protein
VFRCIKELAMTDALTKSALLTKMDAVWRALIVL